MLRVDGDGDGDGGLGARSQGREGKVTTLAVCRLAATDIVRLCARCRRYPRLNWVEAVFLRPEAFHRNDRGPLDRVERSEACVHGAMPAREKVG